MTLQELLRKFFIMGCNLNGKLVATEYLSRLSDNVEENYKIFERFSSTNAPICYCAICTSWDIDAEMLKVISRHLEV